jgi:TolB protein
MDGDSIYDIFIYDIELDTVDRVTDRGANDWGAVFNPIDNTNLIFGGPVENNENSDWAIFSVNIDGSGLTKLTNEPGGEYAPNFSPDGNTILFVSDNEGNEELFLMDSKGNNLRNITNNSANDFYGSFSQDGENIVFSSSRNGPPDIFIISIKNPEEIRSLTNGDSIDTQPDYSPDGSKIIFNSNRLAGENSFDIVTMDPDGSNQIVITENYIDISSAYPKW